MKIFYGDSNFCRGASKSLNVRRDRSNKRYYDYEEYWGNIVVIAEAYRAEDKYAVLYSPNGDRAHWLDGATFGVLAKNIELMKDNKPVRVEEGVKINEEQQLMVTALIINAEIHKGIFGSDLEIKYKTLFNKVRPKSIGDFNIQVTLEKEIQKLN